MDKNVTKKGLLALKDSKPVPITAHSHEIIVPCVYTETVKKMMKEKGIVLPLTPAKLAELRKIAKATPGQYKADPDEKAGGTSHAKGTTNVMVSVKNILSQGRQGVRRRRAGRKGAGRSNIITARASGLIPAPPNINQPSYNLVRPFAANTPVGFEPRPMPTMEQAKLELSKENALEKRLLTYDRLNESVSRLEQQNRRLYSEFLVDEDSFVNRGREEAVRDRLSPKASIEDVSESSAPYEAAEEPAAVPPQIYIWELDKPDLIETIKGKGDKAARVSFLSGYENLRLKTIAKTLGVAVGRGIKSEMVANIVNAPDLA